MTVRDVDVRGKRVLVRVDFNVPLKGGQVSDDTRIRAAIPTLDYLAQQGAAIILCSHLGRPKGLRNPDFSLEPVAERLGALIDKPVAFAEDCIGPAAESAVKDLKEGGILLLENTRFHPEEEKNDPKMAEQLAALADVYVNDAFGSAHRAHASTEGVARLLPAVAGFLMEKEIQYLSMALGDPARPFVAILGGAKISDKIGVIKNLMSKTDVALMGGGMANTFLKAQGFPVGDSLIEEAALDEASQLLKMGASRLHLPLDYVIADKFDNAATKKVVAAGPIPDGWRILDIGPETIKAYTTLIKSAATIVWNGPMGVFEFPNFAVGTFKIAAAVASSGAVSVVGGGDSASAIQQSGLGEKITHISTGGGAALEMLEGLVLPGVAVLLDK